MKRPTITLLATLLLLNSCNNIKENIGDTKDSLAFSTVPYSPTIPQNIDLNKINKYIIENYWSDYNFSDSNITIINNYGEQAFVDYIDKFQNFDTTTLQNSVKEFTITLSKKADDNTKVHFIKIIDSYLYNSNSPFYNELYYEYFLSNIINSDILNPNQKIKYQTILSLVKKNQVGSKATDFSFLSDETRQTLYSIKAENLIIIFYEPSCPVCQETINFLKNSEELQRLIKKGEIKLLALYPDGNEDIWDSFKSEIPSNWINGIDTEQKIIKEGLYDLKASPTLYILDKDKRIIAKDCQLDFIINKFNL